MRKFIKKAVALALAAAMMIPAMGISASAADSDVINGSALAVDINNGKVSVKEPNGSVELNHISDVRNMVALFQFSGIKTDRAIASATLRLVTERSKTTTPISVYAMDNSLFNTSKGTEIGDAVTAALETEAAVSFTEKAPTRSWAMFDTGSNRVLTGEGTAESPYTLTNESYKYENWVTNVDVTDLMNAADGTLTLALSTSAVDNLQRKFFTNTFEKESNAANLAKYKFVMGLTDGAGNPVAGADVAALAYPQLTVTYADPVVEDPKFNLTIDGKNYTADYNAKVTVEETSDDFAYWTKNGKIVSLDKEYTFYACENAAIDAVYKDEAVAGWEDITTLVYITPDVQDNVSVVAEYYDKNNKRNWMGCYFVKDLAGLTWQSANKDIVAADWDAGVRQFKVVVNGVNGSDLYIKAEANGTAKVELPTKVENGQIYYKNNANIE